MITQFTIQNFGLIDKLSLELRNGLNILTGETGAGKSILIDALRYGLGERLDSAQIRNPELPCAIEIVFNLPHANPVFSEYLSKDDSSLIINRIYTSDGRTKIKINGFSVTVSQLKEFGNHLIDFHGPNDHQMLLSSESHINILDRLSGLDTLKKTYRQKFSEYTDLQKKLDEIKTSGESRDRELDLLSCQIKELEQAPLDPEKYEELIQRQTRLNNAEKLYECANNLIQIFENEKSGVTEAMRQTLISMRMLNAIDADTNKFSEKLSRIYEGTNELLSDLQNYLENLSFSPDEAREINNLCDIYYDIKRKYGPALDDAKNFYNKIKERYNFLINLEHNDSEIRNKLDSVKKDLCNTAEKITKERKETALNLKKTIEKELKELGIPHVRFECRIEKTDPNQNGHDNVLFYISPNAGEDLKPLSEIVSSGEAARVMLALKKALTKADPIPVLIFDEIDAQIGGRLGTITGQKLRELSKDRQVLLITHLPQIASFADAHFKVYKKVEHNRTVIVVEFLSRENRTKELAKMMSGEKESSISVTHAVEMLAKAKQT